MGPGDELRARERPEQPGHGDEERDRRASRLILAQRAQDRRRPALERHGTIGTRRRRVPTPATAPDGVSMPTYVYRCAKCGEQIEVFQSFADAPLTKHADCGGKLSKVLSAAGIVLKGSGFYKTDNRSSSSKGASKEKSKESTSRLRLLRLGIVELVGESSGSGRVGLERLVEVDVGLVGLGARRPARAAVRSQERVAPDASAADASRDRRLRRFGLLHLRRRRRGGRARHAVRRAERAGHDRRRRRSAGRVHPPPRPRPRVRAGARSGPRQPLGDADARRAPGHRSVRGRFAVARRSIPATSSCSTSSSTARGAGPTRSTTRATRITSRSPIPTARSSRAARSTAGERVGVRMHDGGTVVVIPGPRFSTRAESRWFRAEGWHVVNMTQYPEAYLARELGMHYAGIALVTDYDTGVEHDAGVAPVIAGAGVRVLRGEPAPRARAARTI